MFELKMIERYGVTIPYVEGRDNATTFDDDGTILVWAIPEADFEEYFDSLEFRYGRWDSYTASISFSIPAVDLVDVNINPAKYSKMRI